FRFTLSAPTGATIARPTTLVSIVDRSTVVPTPHFDVRDAVVDEKDGYALVPVLLGGPAGQAATITVSVGYATVNGTATAGGEYGAVSGTLSFAPGQTVKNVVVPIYDTGSKPSRTFELSLSGPTGAIIGDGVGVVAIDASAAAAVATPAVSAPPDVLVE